MKMKEQYKLRMKPVKSRRPALVGGRGINDADYIVANRFNRCPAYNAWLRLMNSEQDVPEEWRSARGIWSNMAAKDGT